MVAIIKWTCDQPKNPKECPSPSPRGGTSKKALARPTRSVSSRPGRIIRAGVIRRLEINIIEAFAKMPASRQFIQ